MAPHLHHRDDTSNTPPSNSSTALPVPLIVFLVFLGIFLVCGFILEMGMYRWLLRATPTTNGHAILPSTQRSLLARLTAHQPAVQLEDQVPVQDEDHVQPRAESRVPERGRPRQREGSPSPPEPESQSNDLGPLSFEPEERTRIAHHISNAERAFEALRGVRLQVADPERYTEASRIRISVGGGSDRPEVLTAVRPMGEGKGRKVEEGKRHELRDGDGEWVDVDGERDDVLEGSVLAFKAAQVLREKERRERRVSGERKESRGFEERVEGGRVSSGASTRTVVRAGMSSKDRERAREKAYQNMGVLGSVSGNGRKTSRVEEGKKKIAVDDYESEMF
ncbi:uncharacterized protein LY89DRAFT_675719 [Mollisia scopiformis]|uniref:Uncharacterized protein n=1 Tax=Mollisia scopiformis TaxID=149040 RepID=A0A132BAY1_MOLSC|nr:uncharacterized protein LY89DRAFT_675719 [Mollisia scopiformis]KUJ09546.1 hypothetical protein LY89DRAFT_675719 [Mollisia scopiformis]